MTTNVYVCIYIYIYIRARAYTHNKHTSYIHTHIYIIQWYKFARITLISIIPDTRSIAILLFLVTYTQRDACLNALKRRLGNAWYLCKIRWSTRQNPQIENACRTILRLIIKRKRKGKSCFENRSLVHLYFSLCSCTCTLLRTLFQSWQRLVALVERADERANLPYF